MMLAIDIGNTQTVVGVFDGDRLRVHGRFSSRRDWSADEFELTLRLWLQTRIEEPAQIDGVAICSVVPPLEHTVRDAVAQLLPEATTLVVAPGIRTGIPIRYENPKEVGADRIVNAVAAYHRVRDRLVVVDFGTAITFDCVDADGAYLGGAIAPGVHLSTEALFRGTAKLPKIDLEPPRRVIGRSTIESLQSGIFWGFLCSVDGMIEKIEEEMGPVTVLATGGWAETFGRYSRKIEIVEPWLTLEGLKLLYERNRSTA